MGFAVIVNSTTREISGSLTVENKTQRFGPIASGASSKTLEYPAGQVSFKVDVTGAPHSGSATGGQFNLAADSCATLQVTQNGFVNFFTQAMASQAQKISA